MIFALVNCGMHELTTTAAMCSHGTASCVSTPQVDVSKYDPRIGSLGMVTVPPTLLVILTFLRTVHWYPYKSSLTDMVKSYAEMLVNTSSYSTLPQHMSSVSNAHANLTVLHKSFALHPNQ